MAGIYAPTISTSPTPYVEVISVDSTTYKDIQESQGSINYKTISIYLNSQTIEQINEPLIVEKYDSNGNISSQSRFYLADPFQLQSSLFIDLQNDTMIFDGRTRLVVSLLPLSEMRLYFDTIKIEPSDLLTEKNNFFDSDFLSTYGFLDDYNDEISETINKVDKQVNGN